MIYYGADDNASGVSGVLELAHYLVNLKSDGQLPLENIYDYTYLPNAIKIGVPTTLVMQRGLERLTLMVTPRLRE